MRKSALLAFGLVVATLVALGLVVLSSASQANGIRLHHDAYFFFKRQVLYIGLGVVIAIVAAIVDYRIWRDRPALTYLLFGLVLLMLCAVFPPIGRCINGSYRWINLGPINIQPSEFAKIAVVLVLSVWLERIGWRVELFGKGLLASSLFLALLAAPVMLEPDFGSTMVIGLVAVLLMFVAGVRVLHLLVLALAGGAAFGVRVLSNPNRMARMAAWLGMKIEIGTNVADAAAKNAEYQGDMALVAIGNGGLFGVGLNQSLQKHYYLPESHTDMIFAIGAEELGVCFSVGAILLFVLFFALSIHIARHAADRFGRFLVVGLSFIIFFAAMFNMGVVCEAMPMKGMALPFFSYGGTNIVCAFFSVGTILSVGIHSYRARKRKMKHG